MTTWASIAGSFWSASDHLDRYYTICQLSTFRFLRRCIFFILKWLARQWLAMPGHLWLLGGYLAHVIGSLALLAFLIATISLIKSLEPRYEFLSNRIYEREIKSRPLRSGPKQRFVAGFKDDENILDGTNMVDNEKNNGSKVVRQQISQVNLTKGEIQSIYKQLSWSQTQLELESVNWINNSLESFWPSLKTLIGKKMQENLIKLKREKPAVKLDSRPKLSIYLSCRRKLNLLQRAKRKALEESGGLFSLQRFLQVVAVTFKTAIVNLKQFIMDQVAALRSKSSGIESQPGACGPEIDLSLLAQTNRLTLNVSESAKLSSDLSPPKSSGFESNFNHGLNHSGVVQSTPSAVGMPHVRKQLSGPKLFSANSDGLRRKRRQLVEDINRAEAMLRRNRAIKLEEFSIGNTMPVIRGVKFIEEDNNTLIAHVNSVERHILPSDENTMKLLVEVTLTSQRDFCVALSQLPILNSIKLVKFDAQLRFKVSINHTNMEHGQNLEIFQTPDESMFPAVNIIRLTLVDVPKLNWKLKRATSRVQVNGRRKRRTTSNESSMSPISSFRRSLQPVRLINHPFFKYLVHTAVYLLLKWFQPFDIKVGPKLRLKTLF